MSFCQLLSDWRDANLFSKIFSDDKAGGKMSFTQMTEVTSLLHQAPPLHLLSVSLEVCLLLYNLAPFYAFSAVCAIPVRNMGGVIKAVCFHPLPLPSVCRAVSRQDGIAPGNWSREATVSQISILHLVGVVVGVVGMGWLGRKEWRKDG